jgi:hypothetical protein
MSEFIPHDRIVQYQVDTSARRAGAPRTTRAPRPRGRHGLALRLHALANRIDV